MSFSTCATFVICLTIYRRLANIEQWIRTYLTPKYDLDTSSKEKAGIYIEDIAILLHHNWIRDEQQFAHERLRVQLSANLILAGATATRPGALIGKLLYENLEFQVFPPIRGGFQPRIALIVNLEHIKRAAGSSESKRFAFREDDMLLYDPLIPILALAFCDNAFVNDLAGPQSLYSFVVPPSQDRIRVLWKKEWLKRPVFRDIEKTANGPQISLDKPLGYYSEQQRLIRLGCLIGIEKQLEWYDLRRGSGKKLNGTCLPHILALILTWPSEALTPEERNKIMGHRKGDSSTYLQYYMSNFIDVDCQSICFGTAPQHDFVHLATRLRRHEGAPKELTVDQLAEINEDERLLSYRAEKDRARLEWRRQGYRSREQAKGTDMRKHFDKHSNLANNLSRKLKASRLQKAIEDFHADIHVEEINRQLRGIKPADVIAPPNIEYDLPGRKLVAQFFSLAAELTDAESLHSLRVDLITALAQLCKRRESPCRWTDKRSRKQVATRRVRHYRTQGASREADSGYLSMESHETSDGAALNLSKQTGPTCPFCRWQGNHGMTHRTKTWRLDSLARHIRDQHLRKRRTSFACPWQDCGAILANAEHFAGHASRHGLDLPPSVFRH